MDKGEKALQIRRTGCNCCQAVLLAFKDELGLEKEFLMRLASGFGSGMGAMEGPCGALIGAAMTLSLLEGGKLSVRQAETKLLRDFAAKFGAVICREIKGVSTGKPICSCEYCISSAAKLVEEQTE